VIDYSGLEEDLTTLEDADDVKKVEKTLEKQINELQSTINRIQVQTPDCERWLFPNSQTLLQRLRL